MKRKLTIGQVSTIAATVGSAIVTNWDLIGPHVDAALRSSWFIHHPAVKGIVSGIAAAVVIYREIKHRHAPTS